MEKLKHREDPYARGVTYHSSLTVSFFKAGKTFTILEISPCLRSRCAEVKIPCLKEVVISYQYLNELQIHSKNVCQFEEMIRCGRLRRVKGTQEDG